MWLLEALRPYLHVALKNLSCTSDRTEFGQRPWCKVAHQLLYIERGNWKGHHETDHTDLNGWI